MGETTLVVTTSIPHDALDALAEIPWGRVTGHRLTWDEASNTWRDPTRGRLERRRRKSRDIGTTDRLGPDAPGYEIDR